MSKQKIEETTKLMNGHLTDFKDTAMELGSNLRVKSETAVEEAVDFAKKYPLHTALGAGLIGFAVGFLTRRK